MATSLRYQAVKQGGPMELASVPRPAIEDSNEVLIKMKAVALQPLDWKKLYLGILVREWPVSFGLDGVGIVEEVGSDVKRFKPGDAVLGFPFRGSQRTTTHQEYVIADQFAIAKKPESVTFEDAATLPIGFTTAAAAMHLGLGIPLPFLVPYGGVEDGFKPKSVMVLGGSSSVGAATIQLVRIALPHATILTTSSEKHHSHLKALGADKAFSRSASVDEMRAATPGSKGVEAIIDTVNGVASEPSLFDIFDPAGPKRLAELETGMNLKTIPDGIDHKIVRAPEMFKQPGGSGLFDALADLLASGAFTIPVATKVVGEGFESIAKGLEELKAGVSGTKLVVKL